MNASETAVADLFGGLDAVDWDRLAGENFYSTSRWLRHCGSYPGASCGAVPAGGAAATAAVPVVSFDGPPPGNYHWSNLLAARGLPVVPIDGLLVGPRLAYQSHVLTSSGTGALPELVDAVRDRAGRGRSAVAMYLGTADARALLQAGVETVPVLLEPDAWFDVPDGGWEPWLGSMASKRRIAVRREARAFEEAGLRIRHVGLPDCWEELPEIANSMAIKYGYPARTPDFVSEFGRYVESSGDSAQVALCTRPDEKRAIGFCLYYLHGGTIWLRWASFNDELLTGNKEYFNVTYYSQVRLAGTVGATRIHAGKAALEAKTLRGARLRPLWMVDLSENSVLRSSDRLIRQYNRMAVENLRTDPLSGPAIADAAEWEVFC